MERREEQLGAAGAGAAPALDFTVENVEKALHQLYYDPNIENKNLAQKWLMQAQVSPQAWHFSWQLLQPDKVPEIQYFGASALHIKISRYWSDIPTDQYESLKAQLFTQITRFASGSKIVLTRLCVALASLALSMMPDAWPCAVADMVRLFQAEDSPVDSQGRCLALLELLTVLPEEFQTSRLPQYRKGLVRTSLAVECGAVFPLLEQLLQQPSSPSCVRQKVLKCFSSWVQLEVPLQDCEALIQAAFAALQDSELFDSSVEAIVNAISQPDAQRYVNTLLKLIPLVLGLQEQLRQAVQNGDMETSHGICRIAVALGENHSRALLDQVEHWQSFLALVNMIMFCTGIPGHYPVNETTSSLTLTFWYTLQDDILSFEAEKQAVYQQVYRPVYFQLVDVLLHKAQFPSDEEYGFWSSDEKEQFRIYRVDISDTLMYVYEMLGAELLSSLYDKLGRLLTSSEEPYSWQRALSEWLADHPVMINSVLPLVLHALGNPELSVSSVSTLKKICRECKYDLPPYAANIVAVSQDVLMKQIHKTSQCMWLMQALGFLLSALQVEEILKNLHSLISPYIQQLEKLAEEIPNPSNKLAIVHILGLLSNLFTTLDVSHHEDDHEGPELRKLPVPQGPNPIGPRALDMLDENPATSPQPQPWRRPLELYDVGVVVVLQQVFQLIQKVLSKWLNDAQVVEAVCAIFEKSVKTLLDDFAPMVPQLCEMLGRMYSTVPQASALDLTRQLVHIFAHEPAHFPPIEALFLLVTSVTLGLFQQGALKRKPDLFLCERLDVKAVFQCAVLALKFPEAPTVKASCGFFTELLPRCGEIESVGKVVQEDGRMLLIAVLEAIGGQASRSLMDCFADILFALNKHCFSLLSMWIKEALQPPGFPSARLSPEQKDTFSQQILRERVNKRRVKEMVKEFTLLCRGLHGTDYTADY
ncbi:Importin-13 [Apodemus speciosus]|uniref:Importin-13 n=1 Tax=Apodemus speciosus TaxID=105296 RepID=A0ABQ0EPP5_APOSI